MYIIVIYKKNAISMLEAVILYYLECFIWSALWQEL